MDRTAIILAGGLSKRLGTHKGLIQLLGKPLIVHVLEKVQGLVEEVLVIVKSKAQKTILYEVINRDVDFVIDNHNLQVPLIGALKGFEKSQGDFSLLVPCDTPFISKKVIRLLFESSKDVECAIPRWPNGYLEPLQAVYKTESAFTASKKSLNCKNWRMQSIINLLRKIRFVSTDKIRVIDKDLATFFNINTIAQLKKAVLKTDFS